MHQINIREARERISKLITEVEHGEEVVITRRGHAVARLTPVETRPHLPDRSAFRASLPASSTSSAKLVRMGRDEERY